MRTRREFVGGVAASAVVLACAPFMTSELAPGVVEDEAPRLVELGELVALSNSSGANMTVRCSASRSDCVVAAGECWFWMANQSGPVTVIVTANTGTHRVQLHVRASEERQSISAVDGTSLSAGYVRMLGGS